MPATIGPFERAYQSAWQHPGIAVAGFALVLAASARRGAVLAGRPDRRLLLVVLEAAILVDAFFTGALSPLPSSSAAAERVGALFAVLGDARFFYLVLRQTAVAARRRVPAIALSLVAALAVPAIAFAARSAAPDLFLQPNRLYLLYEAMFAALAAALLAVVARGRPAVPSPVRRWLAALCAFELVQYGLWVVADGVIVAGADAGYGLRVIPNALYYAAFVPFAVLSAPDEARA
jgi:hypothetical protein